MSTQHKTLASSLRYTGIEHAGAVEVPKPRQEITESLDKSLVNLEENISALISRSARHLPPIAEDVRGLTQRTENTLYVTQVENDMVSIRERIDRASNAIMYLRDELRLF